MLLNHWDLETASSFVKTHRVIYLYHKCKLKGFALNANSLDVFTLYTVGLVKGSSGKMKNKDTVSCRCRL